MRPTAAALDVGMRRQALGDAAVRCEDGAMTHGLTQAQIDAAERLYAHMPRWQSANSVLRSLTERLSSNIDIAHVTAKVATINSLYGTNVYAIQDVAEHIVEVMSGHAGLPPVELVEQIASVKGLGPAKRDFRFLSFASKYCHFFVDSDQFAIFDNAALEALRFHLGRGSVKASADGSVTYPDYLEALERLRQANQLCCSPAELDRYLWLRGQLLQLRRWRQRHGSEAPLMNAEVLRLFREEQCEEVRDLMLQAFCGGGPGLRRNDRRSED
jgi:hypothetical protein